MSIELPTLQEKPSYEEQCQSDYIVKMEAEGNTIHFPADDELQVDIDSEAQYAAYKRSFEILSREIGEQYKTLITAQETPSRSGLPSRHIRIKLPFKMDNWQRIAWQASLGSDPVRELLSALRAHRGLEKPTLFCEALTWEQRHDF